MIKFLKQDLKRAICSKNFLAATLICFISFIVGIYPFLRFTFKGSIYLFLRAHSQGTSSILCLIAPLIVSIPFSNSYCIDTQSKLINYIYLRIGRKKYFISRVISNGLAGGFSIALPLSLLFVILSLIFGIKPVYMGDVRGAFGDVYNSSQFRYVLILIVLAFIFGIVYSTLGLAISTFINNKYLAIIFPFFVYFIPGLLFGSFGIAYLEPSTTFDPSVNIYATKFTIIIEQAFIFATSVIVTYIGMFRSGDKNA